MTVIAGFKCKRGIVLCADTQETTTIGSQPISKRNVPKLRHEDNNLARLFRNDGDPEPVDYALAFCGAGHGPFIDKLVDAAWRKSTNAENLEEACAAIETAIKQTYKEFGEIYQAGYCPEVELIYGVKFPDDSRLFHAHGPIVNEKDTYCSAGVGSYMADFIASRMYRQGITVSQAIVLSAYILFQAKEHVEGCGGDSHIAALKEIGKQSGLVDSNRVKELAEILKFSDHALGKLVLDSADLAKTRTAFLEAVKHESEIVAYQRDYHEKQIKDWDAFWGEIIPSLNEEEEPSEE